MFTGRNTRAHTQHTHRPCIHTHVHRMRHTCTHTLYIYIWTHLHAHTHRAVIVVLDDHLTFAVSVLAFFLVNVLYFLAAYVLQKVTRTTLPQYCVYCVGVRCWGVSVKRGSTVVEIKVWNNRQFRKSWLSFHSLPILISNPWTADTLLLRITGSFSGSKYIQTVHSLTFLARFSTIAGRH